MRAPVTITATVQPTQASGYRASLVGWGVDDLGHYGSLWTRSVVLEGTSSSSSSREVLNALGMALVSATV